MTRSIIVGLLAFFMQSLFAQVDDPILFTIADNPVRVSEFQYIYDKTNGQEADYSKTSLEEYLDLYTKFKLKVQKAKDMKLDTIPALQNELAGYRQQLANAYLIDRQITNELLKEAYDRMQQDAEISHIMVAVSATASPEDTLAAFNKIKKIQSELSTSGKSFEELAKQYSDDTTTKDRGGKVGYITAMMPNGFYELETAAYTAPLNEGVDPVRTSLGYHLVKVHDRRPARGQMSVAHILVRVKSNGYTDEQAQKVINTVYEKLQSGAEFNALAKEYSQDKLTANKGGFLGFFGINQYERSFEDAAFGLAENGDFSEPFKTSAGWHIVKRLEKKEIQTFQQERPRLEQKIKSDTRFELAKTAMVESIKKENNFTEMPQALWSFRDTLSNSFLTFNWLAQEEQPKVVIFKLGNNFSASIGDFMEYAQRAARQRINLGRQGKNPSAVANELYENFVEEQVLEYEESKLEEKYPDFKALMREYEEGILLFEATKILVWDKASRDTVGLRQFFKTLDNKYMWEERAQATRYTINSEGISKASQIRGYIREHSPKQVLMKFNSNGESIIEAEELLVERGRDSAIDKMNWKVGEISDNESNTKSKTLTFVKIEAIVPPTPKTLREARGYVVADYQDYLEKEWIETLKKEYQVRVNKRVLNKLVKK